MHFATVISVVPLGEKLRCRHQSLIIASLLIFSLLSIEQTEDLKEIALKMSKLPKVNESRPRTVVITHGKEPAIVVKGNSKLFLTCPCSFGRPTQMAYTQIQLLFSSEQEIAWGHVHTNSNLFKKKKKQFILPSALRRAFSRRVIFDGQNAVVLHTDGQIRENLDAFSNLSRSVWMGI